jgi:cytochrome c5
MFCCNAATVSVQAEESDSYENDALRGSGYPPTIPHSVADGDSSETCNICHKTGINGATKTPHPERLVCGQCHEQGMILAPVIPHRVCIGTFDGKSCNRCHLIGIKGAPKCSHPERLECGICHGDHGKAKRE